MVDVPVLVRQFLLNQPNVTSLLGSNDNQSIYCSYDLPEKFDPEKGPAIQIFGYGGSSHPEITGLTNALLMVRVWADVEKSTLAAQLYGAIQDTLHQTTNVQTAAGYILSALERNGPQEQTDPITGWVSINSFYAVIARPN